MYGKLCCIVAILGTGISSNYHMRGSDALCAILEVMGCGLRTLSRPCLPYSDTVSGLGFRQDEDRSDFVRVCLEWSARYVLTRSCVCTHE